MPEATTYRAFLLRVWRSSRTEPSHWLASLEDTRTGERRGFATITEAMSYLEAELEQEPKQHAPNQAAPG